MTTHPSAKSKTALRRAGRKVRALTVLGMPLLVTACGSILDPAPYQPVLTEADQKHKLPSTSMVLACPATNTGQAVFVFADFKDAAAKLCWLAFGYAGERNDIMREKLAFDVPALALGVATLANTAFHGAKDATTALGFGTAAVAGASLYAGPGTRITAYNGAASGLLCASAVSSQMALIDSADWQTKAPGLIRAMTSDIQEAAELVTDAAEKTYAKDLQAARDAAVKALTDLIAAQSLISAGPGKLQAFSLQVVGNATNKVVNGTQTADAVMSLIRTQISSVTGTTAPSGLAKAATMGAPAAAPVSGHAEMARSAPPAPLSPALIAELEQYTAQAALYAKRVNDAWSGFANCAAN